MAPPRPGWSRRAQYGLFFSFIAAIVGLAVGLILLAFSIAAPARFQDLRGLGADLIAPFAIPLNEVSATADGLWSGAGDYWDAANQNGKLKRERDLMRQQLIAAHAILQENKQLKATLQLRDQAPQAVAVGRLIGSSFQSPRRFATISVGSRDGVARGMPVQASNGLVGRVIDTGAFAARVLLISDRASIVPARLLRTGAPVIAQGRGDGAIEVKPLEVGQNPFRRGDIIVSSGTGGLYPPLVPVARVVRTEGDNAVALPLADPAKVSFAVVQQAFEPEAALPPAPADEDLP